MQGFFPALKDKVVRGLSPSHSGSTSPTRTVSPIMGLLNPSPDSSVARSVSLTPFGKMLTHLMKGPDLNGTYNGDLKLIGSGLGQWMKGQLSCASSMSYKRSDLRLLGVIGAPLAPVHVSSTLSSYHPHLT